MTAAIEGGTAAKAVLSALHAGTDALIQPAARTAASGDPGPLTELAVALVAEDGQRIVGALYALPPGGYIAQLISKGIEPARAIAVALAAIKIKALAVPARLRSCDFQSFMSSILGRYVAQYRRDVPSSLRPGLGSRASREILSRATVVDHRGICPVTITKLATDGYDRE